MLTGCGVGEEPAASFAVGDEIRLGIISVSVSRWEMPRTTPPISTLRPPEGEKPVVIFVRWRGLDEYAELDRRTFVEAFLTDQMTLVDSEGFEYKAVTAMPEDHYRMSPQMNPVNAPPNWVVVIWAWVDSDGYSLLIENPDPEPGEFRVAAIALP
jgi:hypothetical protein